MEQQPQEEKAPLGVTGKPETFPNIHWNQFYTLKGMISQMYDFFVMVEQQELQKGNAKYFFEEDLIEEEVENEKGEKVKTKNLRKDFWQ